MLRPMPLILTGLAGLAFVVAGCEGPSKSPDPVAKSVESSATQKDDHGHKPGGHGGIIVEIGRDSYHAEAVFEKGGKLRLYTLGHDESKVQEVEAQPLSAFVKAAGESEASEFVLRPEPQPDDAPGKTSLFVGALPRDVWGKKLDVTIPSLRIGGERFRLGFQSNPESHEASIPAGVAGDDERKLYLTPGGSYTLADIQANGNVTASQKFKGIKANHDLKPQPGEKICPITLTKANPQFAWVIGGKKYEFCCPPCVDEFVSLAKERPADLKEPEYYRKK